MACSVQAALHDPRIPDEDEDDEGVAKAPPPVRPFRPPVLEPLTFHQSMDIIWKSFFGFVGFAVFLVVLFALWLILRSRSNQVHPQGLPPPPPAADSASVTSVSDVTHSVDVSSGSDSFDATGMMPQPVNRTGLVTFSVGPQHS